jgi:hypothetical protein
MLLTTPERGNGDDGTQQDNTVGTHPRRLVALVHR